MDYRLKHVYESMLNGKSLPTKKANTLTKAYEKTKGGQQLGIVPPDALEKLKLVSGIDDLSILQELYECYTQIKQTTEFSTSAVLLVGSPTSRAFKPTAVLNLNTLKTIINESQFDKPVIVTYAGKVRKLRTPSGTRIGEWSVIQKDDVKQLVEAVSSNNPKWFKLQAVKPLIILALYEELLDEKITFVTKLPPGIGAENVQVDNFNKLLRELPPVKLLLPDETDANVVINGSEKIPNVGKADIVLTYNGKGKFWISFKEGTHADADILKKPDAVPGFQQWGSVKTSYNDVPAMKELTDRFLTKCVEQSPSSFVIFDKQETSSEEIIQFLKDKNDGLDSKKRTNISKGLVKDVEKASKIYITNPSAVLYADLFPSAAGTNLPKNSILTACFKAIYGLEFDLQKSINKQPQTFGPENVNIVLETPEPATLAVVKDKNQEPIAVQLTIVSGGHILKNPDMPDSDKYLPCFYLRRTADERFLFNNLETNKPELILCGRTLVYTIGRARREGKTKIELFK